MTADRPSDAVHKSDAQSVGFHRPELVHSPHFQRVEREQLDELSKLPGLSAEACDFLELRGYRLGLPALSLQRASGEGTVVGHALTLRYLPCRRQGPVNSIGSRASRLSFQVAFKWAQPGDVVVMDAAGLVDRSVLGGKAAAAAVDRKVSACIIDGAVRDLDEINSLGFPVWCRGVTPMAGTFDVEGVELNGAIACAGVQVLPGDLVIADISGIAFVPVSEVEEFLSEMLT